MADPFRKAGAGRSPRQIWDRIPADPVQRGSSYRHVGAQPEVCFPPRVHEPTETSEPTTEPSPKWAEAYREASRQLADQVKSFLDLTALRGQLEALARGVVEERSVVMRALEALTERVAALEARFTTPLRGIIPATRPWQSVVGISEETEFSRQMIAEMEAAREADRRAALEGTAE